MTLESCLMTVGMDKSGLSHQNTYLNPLPTLRNQVGTALPAYKPHPHQIKTGWGKRGSELNSSYGSKVQNLFSEKGDIQRLF